MNKNYYEILEILPDADEDKVKAAYRRLARKYHPDVNQSKESTQKFKLITEAYEILSNKQKRETYDLKHGFNKKQKSYAGSPAQNIHAKKAYSHIKKTTAGTAHEKKEAEPDKGSFGTVFNDILEGFFTGDKDQNKTQKKSKPTPLNGIDINSSVTITQKESLEGTKRTINILHTQKCHNCQGRKFINGAICPLCKGIGETSVQKKINVKIPPNVKNGSQIRLANEGNKGLNGGQDGDLFLTIKIETDSFFTYDGNNACCEIPISVTEAVFGATIEIPTPSGTISMKVPPLTPSGQKFRLSGQGIKSSKNDKEGDLVVTTKITMPKEITDAEKDLYEQLKKLSAYNPRENLLNGKKRTC